MVQRLSSTQYLAQWAGQDARRAAVSCAVEQMICASLRIADLISRGPLDMTPSQPVRGEELQVALERGTHEIVEAALREAPVAVLGSNFAAEPLLLDAAAPLAMAVAPLAGSTNFDTNAPLGTTFAIFARDAESAEAGDSLLQCGDRQLAAGFFIYGPQTLLVLSVRDGTQIFLHDARRERFALVDRDVQIPARGREFAINASNFHYWEEPVQGFFADCLAGEAGPLGEGLNMRWVGSVVAETYRVLVRGGIFLYPRDARSNFMDGRLTLISKAFPIALIVEQAGGQATDGERRILDILPSDLQQCVPLVYGSRETVEWVIEYHLDPAGNARMPLFGERKLFS